MKTGAIGFPETSLINYRRKLRDVPEGEDMLFRTPGVFASEYLAMMLKLEAHK